MFITDGFNGFDGDTFKQKIKTFFYELGHATIKKHLYKKAVAYNHRLILNIPETDEVFQQFLNEKEKLVYESKRVMLNLGFDPTEYYFNESDRQELRKQLGIQEDETVIITSTRINKRKNLEKIIGLVSDMNQAGKKVKYILVGFLGDAYEKELKSFIQAQPKPDAFICFPFLNAKEIRKLYCAADTGIWLKVAISIQEAMGTGLPVILENKPSVNHLIQNNINGWFFEKQNFEETIKRVAKLLSEKKSDRLELVKENSKKLSYDYIAQKIVSTLETTA
jgi:glycosyltransferase involved in cell wall biosynthesis